MYCTMVMNAVWANILFSCSVTSYDIVVISERIYLFIYTCNYFFILVLIAYCNLKRIFLFPNLFLVARKLARKKPEDIKTIHFTLFGRRGKVISELIATYLCTFFFSKLVTVGASQLKVYNLHTLYASIFLHI